MLTIQWFDPRTDDADEPAWAVWNTACGTYRVVWSADTDEYAPYIICVTQLNSSSYHSQQRSIGPSCPTLEAAQDAINQYHCKTNNLVLA